MTAIACCLPAGVDSKVGGQLSSSTNKHSCAAPCLSCVIILLQALLSENINKAAEAAEAAAAAAAPTSADGTPAPVPAFNPADSAYNVGVCCSCTARCRIYLSSATVMSVHVLVLSVRRAGAGAAPQRLSAHAEGAGAAGGRVTARTAAGGRSKGGEHWTNQRWLLRDSVRSTVQDVCVVGDLDSLHPSPPACMQCMLCWALCFAADRPRNLSLRRVNSSWRRHRRHSQSCRRRLSR